MQGRIAKIADSLRAFGGDDRRMALEKQRLEILRMRATGAVDVPDSTGRRQMILTRLWRRTRRNDTVHQQGYCPVVMPDRTPVRQLRDEGVIVEARPGPV